MSEAATEDHPQPRWLEYEPVDDLVPDPRNPKGHDGAGLDGSIDRFAFTEPVMVDERTGMLVAGHGRREAVLARKAAGKTPPEGTTVDGEGRWLIPVIHGWRSKDDDDAYAYLIASNRHVENGGWIEDMLAEGLTYLSDLDSLTGVGYTPQQVTDFLASLAPPPDLDGLAGKYGEPQESDLWPVVRFKIPPEQRDRYVKLVAGIDQDDDAALFGHLLDLAEREGA